jgi:hypothetical protein
MGDFIFCAMSFASFLMSVVAVNQKESILTIGVVQMATEEKLAENQDKIIHQINHVNHCRRRKCNIKL